METITENQLVDPVEELFQEFLQGEFDYNEEIEDNYCLWVDERRGGSVIELPVAGLGNILSVSGPPKSRKSLFVDVLLAAFFNQKYSLGFKGKLPKGKKIIYFDTEQHRTTFQMNRRRFYDMCGLPPDTDVIKSFNMRKYSVDERILLIDKTLLTFSDEVAVVVIDGIVDICHDLNDNRSVSETIQHLMRWTEVHNTLLISVLHTNRGGISTNGVLGSTLDKKCDTLFRCSIDEQERITSVENTMARRKPLDTIDFIQAENEYPILYEESIPF